MNFRLTLCGRLASPAAALAAPTAICGAAGQPGHRLAGAVAGPHGQARVSVRGQHRHARDDWAKRSPASATPLMDDPVLQALLRHAAGFQARENGNFQSAGSGVIVDAKNGYIITNHHVVENASEIHDNPARQSKLHREGPWAATRERISAVLQAKQPNLVAMPLGDSAHLEVGDFVVAIGNPFGLQHTVTAGIVSALGRSGINPEGYEDFIQTDASINPGNSGGALVNLKGELVGINSAILSGSGGNIGIGFAIPVNMAKGVMDQLIKYGEVKRGILGVNIYNVTPEIAKEFGLTESTGALVAGSPRVHRPNGRASRPATSSPRSTAAS